MGLFCIIMIKTHFPFVRSIMYKRKNRGATMDP